VSPSSGARGSRALILVLGVLALGIAAAFLLLQQGPSGAAEQRESGAAARDGNAKTERPALELAQASHPSAAREQAESAVETAPAAAPAQAVTTHAQIQGRVLDLDGAPIVGVAIAPRDDPKSTIATSAGDGTFPLSEHDRELSVADERWYTLRDSEPIEHEGYSEIVVVAAPRIRVGGRVLEPDGAAAAGAQVELVVPATAFARIPQSLDRARHPRRARVETASDGSFELDVPIALPAQLTASKAGFGDATTASPAASRFDLELKLAPPAPSGVLVEGVVVHTDGSTGTAARVHFGAEGHDVDAAGRFSFHAEAEADPAQALVAVKRDYQAAVLPGFGAVLASAKEPITGLRLVLGPAPLSIEGSVVDAEGHGRRGWIVQPIDPVLLSEGHIPPQSAEGAGKGSPLAVATDDEGRFVLEGLQDRNYRLQAHSGEELVRIESAPIAAGSRNVRLVVPADAKFERLEGVLVGSDGKGIEGVRVRAALITFRTTWGWSSEHSDDVTTDGEGRFEIRGVPRRDSHLDFDGDAILPTSFDLAEHDGRTPIRVVAKRRCHLRVEGVPETSGFTTVAARGANGQSIPLMRFQSGGSWTSSTIQLEGGLTPVFAVSEDATTLVLSGGTQPEAVRPLQLVPGEITTIRW